MPWKSEHPVTKMVNTRAKIRRSSSQSPIADSDHQFIPSISVVSSNEDILTEILLRLPIRSVLRFKSVSKRWRSIISHRRFSLRRSPVSTSPGLFIRTSYVPFAVENPSPPPFRLDFYPDRRGIRIVQSCYGLLLCCSDRGSQRARKYYVFNPTTRQFAILPSVRSGGAIVRENIRFMALSYDRTESRHYKVVCIHLSNSNNSMFQIQIYSSETLKWKVCGEPFFAPYDTPFECGVYWNNAVHWAPSCANPMYFNLNTERLEPLPLPEPPFQPYQDGAMPLYFGESRGHLHLVESSPGESLNVYEMEGDHSRWFLKYQVELDELPLMVYTYLKYQVFPNYYRFEVFGVIRGEKEEDTFMVLSVGLPGKVIRYNIVEKSFKQINALNNHFTIGSSQVHQYIESLASF